MFPLLIVYHVMLVLYGRGAVVRRKLKKVDPFRPIEFARWAQDQFAAVNQSIALLSTCRKTSLILPSFLSTSSNQWPLSVCVLSFCLFLLPSSLFTYVFLCTLYSHVFILSLPLTSSLAGKTKILLENLQLKLLLWCVRKGIPVHAIYCLLLCRVFVRSSKTRCLLGG